MNREVYYISKTPIGDKIPFAYCHNKKHSGAMKYETCKKHECIAKECFYLELNEKHPVNIRKRRVKALKQARKNGQDVYEFEGEIYSVNDKF